MAIKTFNDTKSGCDESVMCMLEFTHGMLKPVRFTVMLYASVCAYDIILSGPVLKHTGLLSMLPEIAAMEVAATADDAIEALSDMETPLINEDIPALVQLSDVPALENSLEYESVQILDSEVAERCNKLVQEFQKVSWR